MDQLKILLELFPDTPKEELDTMLEFGGVGDFSEEELAFLKACKNADYEKVKEGLEKNKDKFRKLYLSDSRSGLDLLMENFRNLNPGVQAADCVKLLVENSSEEIYDAAFNPLEDSYIVSVVHPLGKNPYVLEDRIEDKKLRFEYIKICEYLIKKGCLITPEKTVAFLRANGVSDMQILEWQQEGNAYRNKKQEEYEMAHPEEVKKEREWKLLCSYEIRKLRRKRLQELRQGVKDKSSLLVMGVPFGRRMSLKNDILDYRKRIAKIEDELGVGEPAVQERYQKAEELKAMRRERDVSGEKIPLRTFLKEKAKRKEISSKKSKEME